MPVYDYEAILEVRRREKEERDRVREERRREKERRKLERAKRRAEKILGRRLLTRRPDIDQKRLDSLIKRHSHQETTELEVGLDTEGEKDDDKNIYLKDKEVNLENSVVTEKAAGEGEEEEEEEEPEAEDDEEDEGDEEEEEEEEEEDEEKQSSRLVPQDNALTATQVEEAIQLEVNVKEWLPLPPPPLKGILVSPGFG